MRGEKFGASAAEMRFHVSQNGSEPRIVSARGEDGPMRSASPVTAMNGSMTPSCDPNP
jgi:hypothetical protein